MGTSAKSEPEHGSAGGTPPPKDESKPKFGVVQNPRRSFVFGIIGFACNVCVVVSLWYAADALKKLHEPKADKATSTRYYSIILSATCPRCALLSKDVFKNGIIPSNAK